MQNSDIKGAFDNTIINKEIGVRIAQIRIKHKLSQSQIAKILGIAQTTYSSYENGNRKIPLEILANLSTYYSISPNYLFYGQDIFEQFDPDFKKKIQANYLLLNQEGRRKVVEYMEDLCQIKKYTLLD